ncbi:class I SAM-dependent methyltransferase [Mycolicibacterium goodii]|uniref:S-adenosyl-L-methionine-dependent methyltransferase n=1 Tax=Mycolicibacterium goodii TaxID=134601 RepID=A0ABS6HSU3_MYCGD|nr:class I SAM-dependent methyltransferase [Mycolicibacterium goodii]MBU8825766.1 class I SAM-dependent methyltransferase [Mycolicibacterium goodii]MBU8839997.1 class I SAM-dependent methyltransferase [Mycolicibacterium goodii]ULN48375.1 class I SAM-dependent methyltransferase [Mycolicibacterium goodii]
MRTDNDHWDITTSVGQTALFVAASRALEARKPHPLAVDPYAEVFCRAAGGDWLDAVEGTDPDHPLQTEFGADFVNFQGARTRFFDEYFRRVADAGVRQVVVLAAGLDSRAYRLSWADGTVVYELDLPKVLEFKRDTLQRHGAVPTAQRREVAIDLRDDWPAALRANGFDPSQSSAWIAEGLLIYLPGAAQEQLFAGIDRLAAPGSFVAIEESAPMPAGAFEVKRAEARASGDPNSFFSLVFNEQCAPGEQWFSARGWTASTTPLNEYLREVGRPVPPPDSEAAQMTGTISLVWAYKG